MSAWFALAACSVARGAAPAPAHPMLAQGEALVPGVPRRWDLNIHCGARVLSWRFNGIWWKTDQARPVMDWVPEGWPSPSQTQGMVVVLELSADSSSLDVTYDGVTVRYHPAELLPSDLCA